MADKIWYCPFCKAEVVDAVVTLLNKLGGNEQPQGYQRICPQCHEPMYLVEQKDGR